MLVLVDESNVVSSARTCGRNLDWLKLRDYLMDEKKARQLIEMVIYIGMPPAMPEWQNERDKKEQVCSLAPLEWIPRGHERRITDRREPL